MPTSLNPVYLFLGSKLETWIFFGDKVLRTLRSNSFSAERIKGGNCGISVLGPTGYQGFSDMRLVVGYSRKLYVFFLMSGLRKQSGPNTFGIS